MNNIISLQVASATRERVISLIEEMQVTRICVPTKFGGRYVEIKVSSLVRFIDPLYAGPELYDVIIIDETIYVDPVGSIIESDGVI